MEPDFRLVRNLSFNTLIKGGRSPVIARILESLTLDEKKRYSNFVIFKGNVPIAMCVYIIVDEKCLIDHIWQARSRDSLAFRDKFKVSPSRYLLEEFVRNGIRRFTINKLGPLGKEMLIRFNKSKLIEDAPGGYHDLSSIHITDDAIKVSKSRSLRHRLP